MKKITIFALNLYAGGIEKYISLLCKMLENDYQIEIITTYKNNDTKIFEFSNKIKIIYLTNDYLERISIKELLKNKKYINIIKELIRRKKLEKKAKKENIKTIKEINTDYIITTRTYHNELVNKFLKNNKVITIATEHNYHNNDNKYINKLIKSVTNFNYIVQCTEELYEFYKDKIKGPINLYIPNMIDIKNKKKSQLNNKQIISVGRLSTEKGYLDLVEVMKEVNKKDKNINLIICGEGQERKQIEDKIKEYKLENNIKLLGFINEKELEEYYINSSLYVLPSISEAFGIVLLEAMYFGLPCIAFDSASGARNLLKDDVGILVNNRNINKMANNIIKLLNNMQQLEKYKKNGLKKINEFSLTKTYEKWKKILK